MVKKFCNVLKYLPSPMDLILYHQETFILEKDLIICEFSFQEFFYQYKIDIDKYSYIRISLPTKEISEFLNDQYKANFQIELQKDNYQIFLQFSGYEDEQRKKIVCLGRYNVNIQTQLKERFESKVQQQIQIFKSESVPILLGSSTLDQYCYISRESELQIIVTFKTLDQQKSNNSQTIQENQITQITFKQAYNTSKLTFLDETNEEEVQEDQEQQKVSFESSEDDSLSDNNEQEIICTVQTKDFLNTMSSIRNLSRILGWGIELNICSDMAWVSMIYGQQFCAIQIKSQQQPL